MKLLLHLVKPKYFIPIHGELRHLKQHAVLAQEVGLARTDIAIVENGYALRFSSEMMEIGERIPGGYVFVDGNWVGDAVSSQVIRERDAIAASGVLSVVFCYARGTVIGSPHITARGVASETVLAAMTDEATRLVRRTVQTAGAVQPPDQMEAAVRQAISDFFYQEARNRPEILVTALPVS
jgi:ribonuclease J